MSRICTLSALLLNERPTNNAKHQQATSFTPCMQLCSHTTTYGPDNITDMLVCLLQDLVSNSKCLDLEQLLSTAEDNMAILELFFRALTARRLLHDAALLPALTASLDLAPR